eukprot:gene5892-4209_t
MIHLLVDVQATRAQLGRLGKIVEKVAYGQEPEVMLVWFDIYIYIYIAGSSEKTNNEKEA